VQELNIQLPIWWLFLIQLNGSLVEEGVAAQQQFFYWMILEYRHMLK
jgi:hypothetical protein